MISGVTETFVTDLEDHLEPAPVLVEWDRKLLTFLFLGPLLPVLRGVSHGEGLTTADDDFEVVVVVDPKCDS
jgi:hypothetical protein